MVQTRNVGISRILPLWIYHCQLFSIYRHGLDKKQQSIYLFTNRATSNIIFAEKYIWYHMNTSIVRSLYGQEGIPINKHATLMVMSCMKESQNIFQVA